MAETTAGKVKRLCSGAYHAYEPQAWLQIYYPLFYLVHVATTTVSSDDGQLWLTSLSSVALNTAVGWLLLWILWVNVKVLLWDLITQLRRRLYSTASIENTEDESPWPGGDALKSRRGLCAIPKKLLNTDVGQGLTPSEVTKRREVYGLNEINLLRSWWYISWCEIASGVSLPLEITTVLAIINKDWLNAVLISALLVWGVYGNVSSVLESRQICRPFTKPHSKTARAIREGKEVEIPSTELVVGDIVHVKKRDVIPADIRLLRINEPIAMDQSAITGESNSVPKYHNDLVYFSTGVLEGDAYGVIVDPAFNSFIGRTMSLLGHVIHKPRTMRYATRSPYCTAEYLRVLQSISVLTCITIALVLGLIWVRREHFHISTLAQLVLGLVTLYVPTPSSTLVYNIRCMAAARLAGAKAVIQGGVSTVEILAGIEVLCSDKTGTMTKNELGYRQPYCIDCSPEDIILTAGLTTPFGENASGAGYDPIEKVFSRALFDYPQANMKFRQYELLKFSPFDPVTKMVKTLVKNKKGVRWTCVKGAPRAVLALYKDDNTLSSIVEDQFRDAAAEFARKGLRALAIARKREDSGAKWELQGLVPLLDPPRGNIKATVELARSLGVDVKMISGDAGAIANHAAETFGLKGEEVFLAGALREYLAENPRQPEQDVTKQALQSRGFCEAFAEDKEAIVWLFRSQNIKVAITGDGFNDQRSLCMADCGIAVEGASESAQASSNVVFLAPGLARIIDAVQLSRQSFCQVQSYLVYRTILALHLTIILVGSYLMYGSSPVDLRWIMLALHISDIVGLQLSQDDARTPITTKPLRWSAWKLTGLVLSLTLTLTSGTALILLATPDQIPGLRAKGAFLGAMLTDHWQCLIVLTNGRFWKHAWHWKSFKMLLMVSVPTGLSHFGWNGESSMNAMTAVFIWLIAVATMLTCSAVCGLLTKDGEMIDVKIQEAEDSDSEEQQGDDDDESVPGSELSSEIDEDIPS